MNEHNNLNDISLYGRIHALPRFKSLLSQKLVGRPVISFISQFFKSSRGIEIVEIFYDHVIFLLYPVNMKNFTGQFFLNYS